MWRIGYIYQIEPNQVTTLNYHSQKLFLKRETDDKECVGRLDKPEQWVGYGNKTTKASRDVRE